MTSRLKAVVWLGFGLMTLTFIVRAYIRIVSFRKLIMEDWLTLVALCIYFILSILTTIYLPTLYNIGPIAAGTVMPGPTYETDTLNALHAFGGMAILSIAGLWTVKVNFLAFFHRLGHQLPKFRIFWWAVFCVVIATGLVEIAIIEFKCLVADFNTLSTSVVLDVLTDALMIIFPLSILWTSRISLRKKLVLSAIFLLIGVTIAITIVRGGFAVYVTQPTAWTELNISYSFFETLEYIASFLVACVISFRSLFTQRQNQVAHAAERRARRYNVPDTNCRRKKERSTDRVQRFYDVFISTCRTLEGFDVNNAKWELPVPPSGLMMVNFAYGEEARDWASFSNAVEEPHTFSNVGYGDLAGSLEFEPTAISTAAISSKV
ncbi:hypothetical protein GGR55DRAFT_687295 [Xylaria sp. FL0064]|nr:hypothetical protein GGR55DRAFT_687295 [Xylaria sp. FL0064]